MRIAIGLGLALAAFAAAAQGGARSAAATRKVQSAPDSHGAGPAAEQQQSPRERILAVADAIPKNATPAQVEQLTAGLGKPRVSYQWCNEAGCVSDVSEARGTRMWASWTLKEPNGGAFDDLDLTVIFCGDSPDWQAHDVRVERWPAKMSALGTLPKSEKLHDRTFEGLERCFAK